MKFFIGFFALTGIILIPAYIGFLGYAVYIGMNGDDWFTYAIIGVVCFLCQELCAILHDYFAKKTGSRTLDEWSGN